jgi:hypothetical protein
MHGRRMSLKRRSARAVISPLGAYRSRACSLGAFGRYARSLLLYYVLRSVDHYRYHIHPRKSVIQNYANFMVSPSHAILDD